MRCGSHADLVGWWLIPPGRGRFIVRGIFMKCIISGGQPVQTGLGPRRSAWPGLLAGLAMLPLSLSGWAQVAAVPAAPAALAVAAVSEPPDTGGRAEAVPGATLAGLRALARRHNPEYAALQLETQAAQTRSQAAEALPDPLLRVELQDINRRNEGTGPGLLPNRVGSTRYSLIQPLSFVGRRDLQQALAQAEARIVEGQAGAGWLELASALRLRQADRYRVHQTLRITREMLGLASALEQTARRRYAQGLTAQQDVLRAQMELSRLRAGLLALAREQAQADLRLNALLDRPLNAPLVEVRQLSAVPEAAQLDFAMLEQRLLQQNPQLAGEQAAIEAAEKKQALSLRDRYPDVVLGLAPTQVGSRIQSWEFMVEMNSPWQQDGRRAREQESTLRLAAAQVRRHEAQNRLQMNLADHLAALERARSLFQLGTQDLLPQAEAGYRMALAGYENGRIDFMALLDAGQQVHRIHLEQLANEVEMQTHLAEIERLTGAMP